MTLLQAVVYGLVQGLGEFLPISSSAHLVLVPWFFGWTDPGLTFDVALHVGTLVAVIAYFWRDWCRLIVRGFTEAWSPEGRLFWYLVIATIPGGIGGFLLEKKAEDAFRAPLLIAVLLMVMGLVLYAADHWGTKKRGLKTITLGTSLSIGISQVLAVIPGVSRSGITITTGLATGLTREAAARFSFLLSTPIILGAAMVKVPHLLAHPRLITGDFVAGIVVSCITGFASIGFFLRYIQTRSLLPFVVYRVALGVLVIIFVMIR
ncbi:MAG: undecaprenyl-diphosphate phosphatase [Syntrophorhabdales bacterium]|jgi:undecaprenyl-diphosphatase